ncbi:MAG TPA: MYXO-CTERM sorting domain-containing protein, partial [Polyangiaceae bacterium]
PIMYAQYQPGHTHLTQDDVDAICAVYPPIPPNQGGCSAGARGGAPGAWASLGVLAVLLRAASSRRRR